MNIYFYGFIHIVRECFDVSWGACRLVRGNMVYSEGWSSWRGKSMPCRTCYLPLLLIWTHELCTSEAPYMWPIDSQNNTQKSQPIELISNSASKQTPPSKASPPSLQYNNKISTSYTSSMNLTTLSDLTISWFLTIHKW